MILLCSPKIEFDRVVVLSNHNFLALPDIHLAAKQHQAFRETIQNSGASVENISELPGHPNSVFTRDVALCTPKGYIRLRMGLSSRRGEETWMAGILDSMGIPQAGAIEAPGTIEGGDIFLCGKVALVGESGRSNREGVEQISSLLGGMGYEVRVLKVPEDQLHLGSIMSPVGRGSVLCNRGLLADAFLKGFRKIEIPEGPDSSANVLGLGDGQVVAEATNKIGIAALEAAGFRVTALDLSEFQKGGGGPTCLTLPVETSG